MKDEEQAARFAEDLAAKARGTPPAPGADEPCLELARRLSELDFSAQSRVRASLRARLLGRGSERGPAAGWPFGLRLSAGSRAGLAAAFAALFLIIPLSPLFRGAPKPSSPSRPAQPPAAATAALERPATEPREPRERPPLQRRAPRTPAPLPRLAGTFPVSTGRAESVFRPVAGRSPFQAVSPEGSRSLFQTVPAGPILTSVKGRRIATPQGRAMVWEREDATFILEVRPIRMADLFVKPEL